MFNLFLDVHHPKIGGLRHALAESVERQYLYIESVLTSYYARSAIRLPNDHVMVQVLRGMSFADDTPFEHIVASVYARAPYVAKHYGFTSPISFGRPHKSTFYAGHGSVDYIFESPIVEVDPWMDRSVWRHVPALKVLYHPVTDFHFLLPKGQMPYENNFSVVQVDLALLVLQYHCYKQEQRQKFGTEAILNPSAFLMNEALPKLYQNHLDFVVLNNLFLPGGFMERGSDIRIPWPPVSFPDVSGKVRTITQDMHRRARKSRANYLATLQNTPVPTHGNAWRALALPKVPVTKQGYWVMWLARFRYMFDLIRLEGDAGIKANRQHISTLKRELGYFMGEQNYRLFQNKRLEEEFQYFADYIKNV